MVGDDCSDEVPVRAVSWPLSRSLIQMFLVPDLPERNASLRPLEESAGLVSLAALRVSRSNLPTPARSGALPVLALMVKHQMLLRKARLEKTILDRRASPVCSLMIDG